MKTILNTIYTLIAVAFVILMASIFGFKISMLVLLLMCIFPAAIILSVFCGSK